MSSFGLIDDNYVDYDDDDDDDNDEMMIFK